jgi:hypothetical protein
MASITSEIIAGLARNDDFGFEMRVGRELRQNPRANVRHGESYVDPRSGKEREFDFQFVFTHEWRRIQLAIECKNLFPDSPAVVCGHKRISAESFHEIVFAGNGQLKNKNQREGIQTGTVSEVVRIGPESDLYPTRDPARNFVGKSVFRPKPPASDKPYTGLHKLPLGGYSVMRDDDYDRWNQAAGSAGALALNTFEHGKNTDVAAGVATMTLPVFAVPDETLWQLEFSDEGEIAAAPQRADHITVYRDIRIRRTKNYGTPFYRTITMSHVHFVTLSGLRIWLAAIENNESPYWDTILPEHAIQEVTKRFTPYAQ